MFFIALLPGKAWAGTYNDASGTSLYYDVNGDEVIITGGNINSENLVIPSEIEGKPVTTIAAAAFEDKVEIVSIKFPASVTTIGESAFQTCSSLTKISFDENSKLATIGDNAFYQTDITEITIPKSVILIGDFAIESDALTKVTFLSETPCELGAEPIYLGNDASIIVPAGTGEAYKSASSWSDYAPYIKEAEATSIRNTQAATSATHAAIYSLDGKLASKDGSTAGLAKGIYIQNGKKVVIGK